MLAAKTRNEVVYDSVPTWFVGNGKPFQENLQNAVDVGKRNIVGKNARVKHGLMVIGKTI